MFYTYIDIFGYTFPTRTHFPIIWKNSHLRFYTIPFPRTRFWILWNIGYYYHESTLVFWMWQSLCAVAVDAFCLIRESNSKTNYFHTCCFDPMLLGSKHNGTIFWLPFKKKRSYLLLFPSYKSCWNRVLKAQSLQGSLPKEFAGLPFLQEM